MRAARSAFSQTFTVPMKISVDGTDGGIRSTRFQRLPHPEHHFILLLL